MVKIGPPPKSREQEQKYHAMIGDIASQHTLFGRKWGEEDMKRLVVDQFYRDTKDDPDLMDEWKQAGMVEMCPSIDGKGVVQLGAQTRRFTKKLASAFVEWLFAFGAETGIIWSERMLQE